MDQLARAGQKIWQILPLGPTGYGASPYQSFSTFAGNACFIDLEKLVEEGLLTREECESFSYGTDPQYVDYDKVEESRDVLLRKAYSRLIRKKTSGILCGRRILAGRLCAVYGL